MARLVQTERGLVFVGSPEADDDLAAAERTAAACGSYRRDDEDEDPVDGAVSCFGCRYRRWAPGGFTCVKDRLGP